MNISVRKIDDKTASKLRVMAARHGVSMEEEIRRIIKRAVRTPEHLGNLAKEHFGPEHGVELDIPKHKFHNPIDLGE